MNDFSNYQFRTSSLPALMTSSRSKSDPLSETAKEVIRKCYIQEVYNRREFVQTPPMLKGTMVESDILDLLETVTGDIFFKNNEKIENDFINGTPDVSSHPDRVIDAKASWTIWTFAAVDEDKAKKDYFWQLCGYAWMQGKRKGQLVYGLVNTPEELITREIMKAGGTEAVEERVRRNHTYDDIAPEKRIKSFLFEFTPEDFDAIRDRVVLAREYMASLHL